MYDDERAYQQERERQHRDDEFMDLMQADNPYHTPRTAMGAYIQGMRQSSLPYSSPNSKVDRPLGGGGGGGGGTLTGGLAAISYWVVKHTPLIHVADLGVKLADTGRNWKVNGPMAAMVAMAVAVALGQVATGWWLLTLAALGALLGWWLVPVLGMLLVLLVMFIGLAIVLSAIGVGLWVAWQVLNYGLAG